MKLRLWALTVFAIILTTVGASPRVANQNKTREKTGSLPREARTAKALLSPEAGTVLYLNMGFINKLGIEEWSNLCRWDRNVINYNWDTTLNNPSDPWRIAFTNSISDWNSATLWINYYKTTLAEDILIGKKPNLNHPEWGGWTESTQGIGIQYCVFIHGNIWANTSAPGVDTPDKRKTIAGHELGHGFGLDHAASNAALMYRKQVWGVFTVPQPPDVELVNAAYPLIP